jgi:hypothetical protein
MVRSDWSKRWPDPALASQTVFPGVSLEALQFLHEERHILFHGHEPLDTDTTPTLEGEALVDAQRLRPGGRGRELGQSPREGMFDRYRLSEIRRRPGRLRALHRHLPSGLEIRRISRRVAEAPLPRSDKILQWDDKLGMRVRK